MPSYSYKCSNCNTIFEETHNINDRKIPEMQPCPECSGINCVSQVILTAPRSVDKGLESLQTPTWFKERVSKMNKTLGTNTKTLD